MSYNSVQDNKKARGTMSQDLETLLRAKKSWDSLFDFRRGAERCGRFLFGEQWGDFVDTPHGRMREKDLIVEEGNVPLQNNRIAPMVRAILGQFSSSQTEPVVVSRSRGKQKIGEMMSTAIQYVYQKNGLWELDRRALEYFIVTGIACFRSQYGWDFEQDESDVWTEIVNYNRLFFNGYDEDPRHRGIDLIGEIHDYPLLDVISMFSAGDPDNAARIKEIYRLHDSYAITSGIQQLTGEEVENINFLMTPTAATCRVIEVWTKEAKERLRCHDRLHANHYLAELSDLDALQRENAFRREEQLSKGVKERDLKLIEIEWVVDRFWYYRFLSPFGDVLAEGETPYAHRSHPYCVKIYPFFNGRARSFVSDNLDIQKHINRLIIMQDFVQKASAKGVVLMPEDSLPDGMTLTQIAENYKMHNGIILYKAKPGVPAPHQLISNASNTGIYDMLSTQIKMFDDVSGVSSSLQGQKASSNTPAALYAMQTQNSVTMITDLMESFRSLREERDKKNLKLIHQYYDEPRYIGITGSGTDKDAFFYNPDFVKNIDFDLTLTESTSTPVYRAIQNDFLLELFRANAIDVKMLLENSAMAFADKLLESINRREEEQAQRQAQQQGVMTDVGQPVPEGLDMQGFEQALNQLESDGN